MACDEDAPANRRIRSELFDRMEQTFGQDRSLGACDTNALRLGIVALVALALVVEEDTDDSVAFVDSSGEVVTSFAWFNDSLRALGPRLDAHFDEIPVDTVENPSPTLVVPRERSLEVVYLTAEGVQSAEEPVDAPGRLVHCGERWADFTAATSALAQEYDR